MSVLYVLYVLFLLNCLHEQSRLLTFMPSIMLYESFFIVFWGADERGIGCRGRSCSGQHDTTICLNFSSCHLSPANPHRTFSKIIWRRIHWYRFCRKNFVCLKNRRIKIMLTQMPFCRKYAETETKTTSHSYFNRWRKPDE